MPDERRVGHRYLLVREIASGGMGTVWLARDETLRRDVAIKVLHLQGGITDEAREQAVGRAMREARIAARLHHTNAVQVYDVVDDDHGPSLVMQYIPSRSLAAVVAEDGPLPPHEAARVGTQVAAALAAAHRAGIVHRDVKPGNVLIGDDGIVRITDFGVSHAFDDVTVTASGMLTGTPAFLAPEAARGEDATAAGDVFSLGSTLYFAVEGRTPFGDGGNAMAVLHRVASARPDPFGRAGALEPMLRAMMAPAPADRPAMVSIAAQLLDLHPLTSDGAEPHEAVTRRLRRVPASETVASRTSPSVASAPASASTSAPASASAATPAPTRRPAPLATIPRDGDHERRRTWLPVAAVVMVVAIAVVLAVVVLRNASSSDTSANGSGAALAPPSGAQSVSPSAAATAATPTSATPTTATPTSTVPSSPAPSSSAPSSASTSPSQPRTRSSSGAAASSSDLADAIVSYFRLVPGDLDAGWARLTSSFQQGRAGGRDTYDDYWGSVDRVDVRDPTGDAPRTARADLVYHYSNGRTVSQQTTFRLVREGNTLKIDSQS